MESRICSNKNYFQFFFGIILGQGAFDGDLGGEAAQIKNVVDVQRIDAEQADECPEPDKRNHEGGGGDHHRLRTIQ